jgi:hypothetical protein
VSKAGLFGTRMDSRDALSHEAQSLLRATNDDLFRPPYFVPDRPLSPVPAGERRPFERPELLQLSDPEITYWITDTRFDDVTVTLALGATEESVDPRQAPPRVRFGSSAVGDDACPWPVPDDDDPEDTSVVTVTRRGSSATLVNGNARATCSVSDGAVAIGIALGNASIDVHSLTVRRD